MTSSATPPIVPVFDGHNDALLRLWRSQDETPEAFVEGSGRGHLDLPRMVEGGFAGGMFAAFVPSKPGEKLTVTRTTDGYDEAYPATPTLADAARAVQALTADLFRVERASGGRFKVVRRVAEIEECMAKGVIAASWHIEGAEAIDPELDALEVYHQAGLRSLGLVWSRPNAFGCGVPFRFPSSPDIGPGLTDAGIALVRACNRLGILIDLSHLNEKGFWDVAKLTDAPLVATHSNAHAICPVSRNLTEDQLRAIRESDGMVGLNFAVGFLREDGDNNADTPIETMCRHLDHLIERVGEDRVGLGSDFDGATVPREIGTAAGLQRLVAALRERGYGEALVEKVCYRNWIRVLRATWRD